MSTSSPEAAVATQGKRPPTDAVVVYPSATLRPVPSFTIAVPQGWVVDEAPDAIGVLRTPEEVDGFWVNLLITADRIDRRLKLAHAASISLEQILAQSPDAKVLHDRLATDAGMSTYLRIMELTSPAGTPLVQVQGLVAAPAEDGAKTRDLFQLMGTCPAGRVKQFGPVLVRAIASFKLV